MDFSRKCSYISNGYYNKGLKLAREGDLTNAAGALKRALQFNKRNINARNLLGLIYYRIGEVSDALVQWVLSLNLQPSDNDADRYLDELQRQQGLMDSFGLTIKNFNQALSLAQGGSDDLAIIQLAKIVDQHPDYVRACTLLGLLYLAHDQPQKSYKCVQNALRIDKGNPLALRLLDAIRSRQKEQQGKKKSVREKASETKDIKADSTLIPENYKSSSIWSTIGNILIGLLIGAASIIFIYLPIKEASIAKEYNEQVISISEQLNRVNSTVNDLELSNDALEEENGTIKAARNASEAENQELLSNVQLLVGAVDAYRSDRLTEGAKLYAQIDPKYMINIEDGSSASIEQSFRDLKAYYEGEGYDHFLSVADKAMQAGNWDSAIDNYKLCILICPDRPEPVFKEGLAYKKGGNTDRASELFNEVIERFPESEYADKAREERGI